MDRWQHDAFERAEKVSCGIYIADFNENQRMAKVIESVREHHRWY